MQDQQLPTEVPAPGGSAAKHIHFRRYRELHKLHSHMVAMQRRASAYPPSVLGPRVAGAMNLLASHTRAFYFYSDDRREQAVGALEARSHAVEPSQEDLDAAAAREAAASTKGTKTKRRLF